MLIMIFVIVMTLFALMLIMIFVIVMTLFILMLIMIVATFAKLDGLHRGNGLEDRNAVVLGGVDHVDQALFKVGTIDNHDRCVAHCSHLLGRCLEVVRVGAHGHDRDDVHLVSDDVCYDISQDVGGYRHGRGVCGSSGGGGDPRVAATCRRYEGERQHKAEQFAYRKHSCSSRNRFSGMRITINTVERRCCTRNAPPTDLA